MDIKDFAKEDFMVYSMEVIKNRAIPGVDGLKPIHRRILHIMNDTGNVSNKPTRKCAKIVGETMSRAHPHGDSSIYDALVRLAQDWKMRYPLVEVQGNEGNIQGDKAAASRYTECRLTPLGELMTKNTDKKCVPMELNYSDEEYLPLLLTSEFPNLLCNPSLGIAVSMSSTTLPHNLNEVVDALVKFVENGGVMTIDELFNYIKAPDFPTGGIIINGSELKKIYTEGGSIKVRSKYEIEEVAGRKHIVIKEIPYLVNPMEKIYDRVKKMVLEEGYTDIENIQNNIGNKGFEIRIICSKGANVNKVIRDLCEKTGFQAAISMNNTVLINGTPRKLSYIEMMSEYVKFRHNVIKRIAAFDKEKDLKRLHIIDGLLIALADIDNIITIIKGSENKDDARQKLIAKYDFSREQVDSILDMKLSRLTNLESEDLRSEKGELLADVEKQNKIIDNIDGTRDKLLISQWKEIKAKFGDARKTAIMNITEGSSEEAAAKDIICLVGNTGLLALEPSDSVALGKIAAKTTFNFGYRTNTKDLSYLFDCRGKIHKINNSYLDIGTVNPISFDNTITCGIGKLEKQWLITVTKNGLAKKTSIDEYKNIRNTSSVAMKVKEGDYLFAAVCADDDDYLFILGENGNLAKVKVSEINAMSRATLGGKCINAQVKQVAGGKDNDTFLTVESGKIKLTKGEGFSETAKASFGNKIGKDGKTVIFTNAKNDFYYTHKNKLAKKLCSEISIHSKNSSGSKFDFDETDFIIA